MSDLIKALTIFLKYKDSKWPTHCDHDVLSIMDVDIGDVSEDDVAELDRLGFFYSEDEECFQSFRYGSA